MSRIAIFDSGVGGLSIYQEIKQKLPDSQYVFVSDNQAFPYGTKPEEELIQRVLEVAERVIDQYTPDLLVIACNTASTVVLPQLREAFELPIVGVVPAIKPAGQRTVTQVIGLLATPATVQRDYTNQLIQEFAEDCEVIKVGSSRLVQIAEDKLYGREVDSRQIQSEIEKLLNADKMDCLVLACTHFPLLNKELSQLFQTNNQHIELLDSRKGIANRVNQLLAKIESKQTRCEESVAAFTELNNISKEFKQRLNLYGFTNIGLLL